MGTIPAAPELDRLFNEFFSEQTRLSAKLTTGEPITAKDLQALSKASFKYGQAIGEQFGKADD